MRYEVRDESVISIRSLERAVYVDMFIQDVSNSIMPIGGRADRKPFAVRLEGADSETEDIVSEGLGGARHTKLAEAVCDFVRAATQVILTYGSGNYEICYCSTRIIVRI